MKTINSLPIKLVIVALLSGIFPLLSQNAPRQNPIDTAKAYPINLESVLQLSGAGNLTIQEYQLRYQLAQAQATKAKEWWLPSFNFGITTHYLDGAAMNTDGNLFYPVTRNNLWAGLGIMVEWDFSKGIYGTLAAKQNAEAIQYEAQAERNRVILSAIEAYYDLQVEEIKFSALYEMSLQADTLAQQIRTKMNAGMQHQSDYLLAQSNVNHYRIMLLQSKSDWLEKSARLRNILNLQDDVILVSSDSALVPINLLSQITGDHPNDFYMQRPEYLSMRASLFSLQTERKNMTTELFIPKLRFGLDNGMFGIYSTPLYYTWQINASLMWQLPLGRFTYRGDLRTFDAKILIQENRMEQFRNLARQQLSQSSARLQTTSEQIALAKEALRLSAEGLAQSMDRQKTGTAIPMEAFQAQQFYMQAQLDYAEAVKTNNVAQYEYKVYSGGNL